MNIKSPFLNRNQWPVECYYSQGSGTKYGIVRGVNGIGVLWGGGRRNPGDQMRQLLRWTIRVLQLDALKMHRLHVLMRALLWEASLWFRRVRARKKPWSQKSQTYFFRSAATCTCMWPFRDEVDANFIGQMAHGMFRIWGGGGGCWSIMSFPISSIVSNM